MRKTARNKSWAAWTATGGVALLLTVMVLGRVAPQATTPPLDRDQARLRCTSLIVGRDVSQDGSVILGHNEDLGDGAAQHYQSIAAAQHAPGEVITLWSGAQIPQVLETFAYSASVVFDAEFIPGDLIGGINQHQVAVANNTAHQRGTAEPYPSEGRILWSELMRLALERARTAREAVQIMGDLCNQLGLGADPGSMFAVTDPQEGWWLEVSQDGPWVAQRVPDDAVSVRANAYRIGVVTFDDPSQFLYSADLVSHAIERGWYAESEGPFNFGAVYGDVSSSEAIWNTHREARVQERLSAAFPRVAVDELMGVLRDHYEGSAYDSSAGGTLGSPHLTEEYCPCDLSTEVSTICQSRGWLPADIGALCWRAMATPCTSVYVPWYLSSDIPTPYATGTHEGTEGSAYWTFRSIAYAADPRYVTAAPPIRSHWERLEHGELMEQTAVEQQAVVAFASDREAARTLLRDFSRRHAELVYQMASTLLAANLDPTVLTTP